MTDNTPIILYRTDDGLTDMRLKAIDGTVWLSQLEIADLFQSSKQNISHHIRSILDEGELTEGATVKNYLTVQTEGKRQVQRDIALYNLDMILAVGYRIKSPRGTQFRQWATTTLRDYLVKGFVMHDERLKNPDLTGGMAYFDELLERIREIRASEKLFYQKVKDIYVKSADYDPQSDQAQLFFKTVQNKMLFGVTGKTAAELVVSRSDSALSHMGLVTYKGARVRKDDVITAKNYLREDELSELNRIVTMFLDLAEDTALRRQSMMMKDWEQRLDEFLRFNERPILTHAGSISHNQAEKIVYDRYDTFNLNRREQEKMMAEREAASDLQELQRIEKQITGKNKKPKGVET